MMDTVTDISHPDERTVKKFKTALEKLRSDPSDREAENNLRELFASGVKEAYVALGNVLVDTERKNEALALFIEAGLAGDSSGSRNAGYCYALGIGCEKDKKKAVEWYTVSAKSGNAKAQCNLGVMYSYGNGTEQNYAEAAYWFRKSAEGGYSRGQTNLGELLTKGLGVERNPTEAAYWFGKSGSPRALHRLALLYLTGDGVEKNTEEAISLLEESSERGYAKACVKLADLIETDNPERALELYRKAAEKGNKDAIEKLNASGRKTL